MQAKKLQFRDWFWLTAVIMYAALGVGNAFYGNWFMATAMLLLVIHAVANVGYRRDEVGPWTKLPYLFYAGLACIFLALIFS